MNDQNQFDSRQPAETLDKQSPSQPSVKQPWSVPSLTVIDINQGTEAGGNLNVDGGVFSGNVP